MKHGGTLLALLLWAQSGWAGPIELEQFVEFKWRGLTVATMNFAVSIPVTEELAVVDGKKDAPFEPLVLIELVGQTKGPLRWLEDYQATVRYQQQDAQGLTDAFTLTGTDNGDPEHRHIEFDANRLPEVKVFDDSTATEALAPHEEWLGNTINPLGVFKSMLMAAASQESCEADVWGYDGKRRYRLTLRDVRLAPAPAPSNGAGTLKQNAAGYDYACELTMYAQGRQSAIARNAKPSFIANRFAALWPFSDDDRRMTFVLRALPVKRENSLSRMEIAEVRIHTKIGAIVGNGSPQG
jgi:hypothetical protein